MANSNPPKKNQAFTFEFCLSDLSTPGSFLSAPTILAAKFKTAGDGAAPANTTNLPVNDSGIWLSVTLTAAEMNFDRVYFQAIDTASPKLFADWAVCILTTP